MDMHIQDFIFSLLPAIIIIAVWDAVWKIIAMWKSTRRNQLGWFICIAIFNTAGVLPIVYLLVNKGKSVAN